MNRPIYVLGHKNPDTDSVCAAVGYAELMHGQGHPEAVAGRQGALRPETEYVLQRFGIAPPALITDVRPRVRDIMTSAVRSVSPQTSLLAVGKILEEHDIRVVTVVDGDDRLLGVTGQADFARGFLADLDQMDYLPLDRANLLEALQGRVLVDAPDRRLRDQVMVGAMEIDSMLKRLQPEILFVVGDRTDVQRAAIEFGVGGLIVTGDNPVDPEIVDLARSRQVLLVAVPHHTYRTLRLIQLSVPVSRVMQADVATCGPDELVEDARDRLQSGSTRSLIVVDEQQKVCGILSRSNLLRTVRNRVVLVDHNERGQAVTGIEDADVQAVIDHHRVADFWTRTPPYMRLEPVGATSTIVAKLFAEAQVSLTPPLAGVLLSGILADTLLFRGPTTTAEDQQVARRLAEVAQVDSEELGRSILERASDVSDRSAEQLLLADFKEFTVDAVRFGIGTIETTNAGAMLTRLDEMLRAMRQLRNQGYDCVLFAVIDILHERTTILVEGETRDVAAAFNNTANVTDHAFEVPSILSRKKNIVPVLGTIAGSIKKG